MLWYRKIINNHKQRNKKTSKRSGYNQNLNQQRTEQHVIEENKVYTEKKGFLIYTTGKQQYKEHNV